MSSNNDRDSKAFHFEAQETRTSLLARHSTQWGISMEHEAERDTFCVTSEQREQKDSQQSATRPQEKQYEKVALVDTQEALRNILDRLENLDNSQAQVVIDFEGLDYKKYDTIDIMELYIKPDDVLYLVDVTALKDETWTIHATHSEFCLAYFLASEAYKKIMWDLRLNASVMFQLYSIRLAGIIDCSIWAIACRDTNCWSSQRHTIDEEEACHAFLGGKISSNELQKLREAKAQKALLGPRPWAIRPLPKILINCATDTKYMAMVYGVLHEKLNKHPQTIEGIKEKTGQELRSACNPYYEVDISDRNLSPYRVNYIIHVVGRMSLNRQKALKVWECCNYKGVTRQEQHGEQLWKCTGSNSSCEQQKYLQRQLLGELTFYDEE